VAPEALVLQSRALASETVVRMKLDREPKFDPSLRRPTRLPAVRPARTRPHRLFWRRVRARGDRAQPSAFWGERHSRRYRAIARGMAHNSRRLRPLIDRLAEKYVFVILDSAPVLAVSETILLSQIAQKPILVVKWGSTPTAVARRAATQLLESGGTEVGVLLSGGWPRVRRRIVIRLHKFTSS
jgi:hypothetical protein